MNQESHRRLPSLGERIGREACGLRHVLTVIDLMKQVLRPLAEKRGLDTWEKIVGFAGDEWFPSRLPFGRFKVRVYQEAEQDAELKSWLRWLADSSNEKSSKMGGWYLAQLENGCGFRRMRAELRPPPGWWFSSKGSAASPQAA